MISKEEFKHFVIFQRRTDKKKQKTKQQLCFCFVLFFKLEKFTTLFLPFNMAAASTSALLIPTIPAAP